MAHAKVRAKAAASSDAIDPAFAKVVAAFARNRGVELTKMFASQGLRAEGSFFAFGSDGDLVLKLPATRVRELLEGGHGMPFRRGDHGPAMKEWIRIPAGAGDWIALAREAHTHATEAKKRR